MTSSSSRAQPPAMPADERGQRIWLVLIELAQAVSDAVAARLGDELAPHLTNNSEGRAICRLAVAGPLRPRDLQATSGITSGGITHLLDRLEQLGIIERDVRPLKGDRRAILVSLTGEGHRAAVAMGQGVLDVENRLRGMLAQIGQLVPVPPPASVAARRPIRGDRIARGQRSLLALIELGHDGAIAVAAHLGDRELVNNADVSVICRLAVAGPLRPRVLQGAAGLTSGGTTRLLDRLEQRGIVERRGATVAGDRRAVLVSLTPEGRRIAIGMGRAIDAIGARVGSFAAEIATLLDGEPGAAAATTGTRADGELARGRAPTRAR